MLKIMHHVDRRPKTIMTYDIPPGQAFYGTMTSCAGIVYSGLFYKATTNEYGPKVICLEPSVHPNNNGGHATWSRCSSVENYEPVNITIMVER